MFQLILTILYEKHFYSKLYPPPNAIRHPFTRQISEHLVLFWLWSTADYSALWKTAALVTNLTTSKKATVRETESFETKTNVFAKYIFILQHVKPVPSLAVLV